MDRDRNQFLFILVIFIYCLVFPGFLEKSFGQSELQAWGNMTGIRIEGELMGFESSIRVVGNQWSSVTATAKERQRPKFYRDSAGQTVITKLGNISFTEKVKDAGPGTASVAISTMVAADTTIAGTFFCISVPMQEYGEGTIQFDQNNKMGIAAMKPDSLGGLMKIAALRVDVRSISRQLNIQCQENGLVYIRLGKKSGDPVIEIYLPLQTGHLTAGQKDEKTFTIQASGTIDKKDIHLTLDTGNTGRIFAGFGGNFRIQNLKTDPQVIDYCLKNMRVAWGRVEMPWRFWQPEKNMDPMEAVRAGKTDAHVQRAMAMAEKLQQQGIPVILTAWSAPDWAIIGKPAFAPRTDGVWGNPLNPDSVMEIYKSIADYILCLRDQYHVEVKFFSFNESDLGIYVRQTGEQHDELIRGLGKYFLSKGLKTKILLGDNSDATTYSFIEPALLDPAARPYIGAVSFHSWRGWETELLSRWAAASREINLPLIVGEGSIDAAAWAYPAIFLEQTYTMEEINLYIRLMSLCQPLSILQWQLTSDYSPLTGGGIFGKEGPLEPTQRFWNLKQLASTPGGLYYLGLRADRPAVTCAALGSTVSGKYVLHIVNSGTGRKVELSGIPKTVKSFTIYSTSKTSSMHQGKSFPVHEGKAGFILTAGCFTTLVSE